MVDAGGATVSRTGCSRVKLEHLDALNRALAEIHEAIVV